jgi:hypothetical protein
MDRPRVKFGGQTEEEAEGNLTLASLIRDQRGNPALTAWEEGFLTDIERLLRSHDGRVTLTDKQFDRLPDLRETGSVGKPHQPTPTAVSIK